MRLLAIIEEIAKLVGPHHPWLMQEAARLALALKKRERAEYFLGLALKARHRWLAVTASFLDATPRRRDEKGVVTMAIGSTPDSRGNVWGRLSVCCRS